MDYEMVQNLHDTFNIYQFQHSSQQWQTDRRADGRMDGIAVALCTSTADSWAQINSLTCVPTGHKGAWPTASLNVLRAISHLKDRP